MPYRQPPVEPSSDLRCPRCQSDLRKQAVGPNQVERCASCHGVWISAAEFNELIGDLDRREAVRVRELPHRQAEDPGGYLACPRCDEIMARRNFGRTSGILVDTCKKHGIWLDRGELRRVVEHLAERAPESIDDASAPARRRPPASPPAPDLELAHERSLLDVLIDILTMPFT
ncbi:MAG TPA: zf-TFIIB domain-containing protein [Haliangium sp.]|nr:zf-TFIIB domain-containing protein [Haliangium sp.]